MDEDFDMPPPEELNNYFDLLEEIPFLKVGEEKQTDKQGLKKKLLKEGESLETPDKGDKVEGVVFVFKAYSNQIFLLILSKYFCFFVLVFVCF